MRTKRDIIGHFVFSVGYRNKEGRKVEQREIQKRDYE